jgi:hypothetical protein
MNTAEKQGLVIDAQIKSFVDAIDSKEDFEHAIVRLSLLLSRKINLRPSDFAVAVNRLRQVESDAIGEFTRKHRGTYSPAEAAQNAEQFRLAHLDKVLESEGL